jgi:hypothetical protein
MRSIITIIALLYSSAIYSQCNLEIQSLVASPVSCNGLSDGEVTVNVTGANGATSFSSGGSGTIISPNQSFNASNTLSITGGSGPLNQWWSPSTCTGGSYIYSSTLGCPSGSAVYNGSFTGFSGCFLRSPQLNMNGIDLVNVSFNLTHSFSASRPNDRIRVYCWVNNGYMSIPANYTINGTAGQFLNFNQPRNCEQINVTVNLSGIPTNSRSDFLFYIETSCQYSNCSSYQAIVDNIVISESAPTQASNVFTGLPSGDFQVTVTDASGCTVTQSVFVPQPAPLTLNATATATTTINGNDGTATVTVNGGNSNPQFVWNTTPVQTTSTATGLSPGTYTVNVTDSEGCLANTQVVVDEPSCDNFLINSVQSSDATCFNANNGNISITAQSPNGNVTYSLNNQMPTTSGNYSNLAAGTYTIEISDAAGCIISTANPITINQPEEVISTIILDNNLLLASGFETYQWFLNGEMIPNATDSVHIFTVNGMYYVQVTDENGCEGISNSINVTTTSIDDNLNAEFEIFPNPITEYFFIKQASTNTSDVFQIYSISGQLIMSEKMTHQPMKINASRLAPGIYTLKIISANKVKDFKLIKY